MLSLNELVVQIAKIRNSVNSIEVRGIQNMQLIMGVYETCDHLIESLNRISEQIQNEKSSTEEGDVNGGRIESDTESS